MNFIHSKFALTLLASLFLLTPSVVLGDIITSGSFEGTSGNTGSFVVDSTTFNLTAAELPLLQLDVDFDIIDDGVEVRVNGTSLFISQETSQFGPNDFEITAVQPNDINDPWSPNSNGLPRLNVLANADGTQFSGTVTPTSSTIEEYIPLFSVADFTSLLNAGSNTIEFVSHNGFQGAVLEGTFEVSTVVAAVPEPSTAGIIALCGLVVLRRRRVPVQ